MSTSDLTKCDTCGKATPGHDVTDLLDGWLNLCDAHASEWFAEEQAQAEAFVEMHFA